MNRASLVLAEYFCCNYSVKSNLNLGYTCETATFGDGPRRMLILIGRFGKYCSCHLQGEYVFVAGFGSHITWSRQQVTVGLRGADWWNRTARCIFCWNFGLCSALIADHPRKLKLYVKLQPRKPRVYMFPKMNFFALWCGGGGGYHCLWFLFVTDENRVAWKWNGMSLPFQNLNLMISRTDSVLVSYSVLTAICQLKRWNVMEGCRTSIIF
jgi:hypothetical protein